MAQNFAETTELAAEIRGDPPVERKYIDQALDMIRRGEVEVEKFVSGMPDLKAVFELATKLEAEAASKH